MKKYLPHLKIAGAFIAIYVVTLLVAHFAGQARFQEITVADFTKVEIPDQVMAYEPMSDKANVAVIGFRQGVSHLSIYNVEDKTQTDVMGLNTAYQYNLFPSTNPNKFFLFEQDKNRSVYAPNKISVVTIEGDVTEFNIGGFDCDLQEEYKDNSYFIDFKTFMGEWDAVNFILIPTPEQNILTGDMNCFNSFGRTKNRLVNSLWKDTERKVTLNLPGFGFGPGANIENTDFTIVVDKYDYAIDVKRGDCGLKPECESSTVTKGNKEFKVSGNTRLYLPSSRSINLADGRLMLLVNTDLYIWQFR